MATFTKIETHVPTYCPQVSVSTQFHQSRNTFDKFFFFVLSIFCLSEILSAPIRYWLDNHGLFTLSYIPKFLLAVATFSKAILQILRKKFIRISLLSLVIAILSLSVIGLITLNDFRQTLFGFWVLIPLGSGYIIADGHFFQKKKTLFIVFFLWSIAVMGVLVNFFLDYPWAGVKFDLGLAEVEGSREWTTGGFNRLAGFTRASFEAASQILILTVLLMALRSTFFKVLIFFVAATAIALTTTKSTLFAQIFLAIVIAGKYIVNRNVLSLAPLVFGILGAGLPIWAFSNRYEPDISSGLSLLLFSSLGDRLADGWPDAWHLVYDFGNIITGRGLGGLGAAQFYFENDLYNPGDNLFVYLFVNFGLLGITLYSYIAIKSKQLMTSANARHSSVIYYIGIVILSLGLTTNVLESPFPAIALGCLLGIKISELKAIGLDGRKVVKCTDDLQALSMSYDAPRL